MSETSERRHYERIYAVVGQIPHGTVATYGDVAAVIGDGCDARTVGYALNEIPKQRAAAVPWQRVINSSGGISTRGQRQRALLESEGIDFDTRDRVDLSRHRWSGPDAGWATANGFTTLRPRESDEQPRLF